MKKILLLPFLFSSLFSVEYKYNCAVPHNLIEAIRMTENGSKNPYLIRTNDLQNINIFNKIVNSHHHKKTGDKQSIDCLNEANCAFLTYNLVLNGITNIDLGLYQINYRSYPKNVFTYFDEKNSYITACNVVIDKINYKKTWSWETLAAYHSFTPHFNEIYKQKLIANYNKLENKR